MMDNTQYEQTLIKLSTALQTIAELRLELKILQRAYDELYKERYGGKPVVYAHVPGGTT